MRIGGGGVGRGNVGIQIIIRVVHREPFSFFCKPNHNKKSKKKSHPSNHPTRLPQAQHTIHPFLALTLCEGPVLIVEPATV
jgi:hypothetical protein